MPTVSTPGPTSCCGAACSPRRRTARRPPITDAPAPCQDEPHPRRRTGTTVDSLVDKIAVVTGASSGIGRSYARALADADANVVLVGRNAERLESVAAGLPTETLTLAGDVASAEFDHDVIAATIERFGRIDILLSNAGLYVPGDFAEADLGAVRELLSVNVFGAMAIVREALPHMLAAGSGDILMTSSVSGHQAIHWEPVYSASKHAIQSFTHGVRRQLVGTGVRLGEIAPGVVLNELWGIDEEADDSTPRLEDATGIRSDDVAEAVLFMLTRPRHVNIRDLVILPTSQQI
ncbi:MAG: SDR family oxidoreductase [Herbiconiux sp.]|nr:MAG: SDR family oxidoreductase [Herbiconiux sp.]